jgi:hypothetical protein
MVGTTARDFNKKRASSIEDKQVNQTGERRPNLLAVRSIIEPTSASSATGWV